MKIKYEASYFVEKLVCVETSLNFETKNPKSITTVGVFKFRRY